MCAVRVRGVSGLGGIFLKTRWRAGGHEPRKIASVVYMYAYGAFTEEMGERKSSRRRTGLFLVVCLGVVTVVVVVVVAVERERRRADWSSAIIRRGRGSSAYKGCVT